MKIIIALSCVILLQIAVTIANPGVQNFQLNDNGKACLLLAMDADLSIQYQHSKTKETKTAVLNVTRNEVEGNCSTNYNDYAELDIYSEDRAFMLTLAFIRSNQTRDDVMNRVTLSRAYIKYDTSKIPEFEDPANPGEQTADSGALMKDLSDDNKYYKCDHMEQLSLEPRVTLSIYSMKLQAFNIKDGKYADDFDECANVKTTSNPTTANPSTARPATGKTGKPTTDNTAKPTTGKPTTGRTGNPTTGKPGKPTTENPTTKAAKTTGTAAAPTTTVAPPPTSPDGSPIYAAVDPKTGVKCLVVQFNFRFDIKYYKKNGKQDTVKVNFDMKNSKVVDSSCGKSENELKIAFRPSTEPSGVKDNWALEMRFEKENTTKKLFQAYAVGADANDKFYLSDFALDYVLEEKTFPDTNETGVFSKSTSGKMFETPIGQYYKCTNLDNLKVDDDLTVVTKDFQAMAFRTTKQQDFDGDYNQCKNDSVVNKVVPIIVGIVLAVLVLIVLIAYFIGRRRNTASYEQI